MKPAQKLIVACRQTADAARRLCDWLEANPGVARLANGCIVDDIEGLSSGLGHIATAAETPPTIGIVGAAGAGKLELTLQLLAPRGPAQLGEFGARPLDIQTLRHVFPADDGGGGAAVLRFSTADAAPTPRGYPIRVALLSVMDIAAVLTASRLSAPGSSPELPSPHALDALFNEAANHVSLQPVPGLSGRDVIELREHLTASWGGHPLFDGLTAVRYWERLREIAAHLKDAERRRLLAVLWGNDEATTALFDRLCDGLETLGHGAEASCTAEALIGKDRMTGWLMRHPKSIVDASTMLSLGRGSGVAVTVMSRSGQAVETDRALLSAVIAELPMQIGASRLSELAPAEVLDFPACPPSDDVGCTIAHQEPDDRDPLAIALSRYARAKTIFLFERAARRREITSLVVAVDPIGEDDTIGPLVSEWIETAQGVTAHARERVKRGLFIAAAEPPRLAGAGTDLRREAGRRVLGVMRRILGPGEGFAADWTPGRALTDVYWFARGDSIHAAASSQGAANGMAVSGSAPNAGGAGSGWQSLTREAHSPAEVDRPGTATALMQSPLTADERKLGGLLSPERGRESRAPIAKFTHLSTSELVAELAQAASPRAKAIQLSRAIAETRRRLRTSVARLHSSNDPAAIADWRRSVAIIVTDRLQSLTERGQLGRLRRMLIPREGDVAMAIEAGIVRAMEADRVHSAYGGALGGEVTGNGVRRYDGAQFERQPDAGGDVTRHAEAAVTFWIGYLKRMSRARTLCREIGIEPMVLHHIADELHLGTGRVGLAEEIAAAYRRSSGAGREETVLDVRRLAAYAARYTSAFVETLSPLGSRGPSAAPASSRLQELEVADPASSGYGSPSNRILAGQRHSVRAHAARWEHSFTKLVDENIAAANLASTRGDKDRELGDLIHLFASGAFEVDA